MKYYICEDINDDEVNYVSAADELEKDDLVVFMNYNQPCLARVLKEMPELEAITSEYPWEDALTHVCLKEYYEKRKAQLEKARLIKLMKEQMEIHALEEKLKKNAEINPEMRDLFSMYKTICESE